MDKYILVPWPESQNFMGQPWFRKEAILYQSMDEQEYLDSAYFIPEHRIEEKEEFYDYKESK